MFYRGRSKGSQHWEKMLREPTVMFEGQPPRDEDPAQNADSVADRFGLVDPQAIKAEVDAIVENKLPPA